MVNVFFADTTVFNDFELFEKCLDYVGEEIANKIKINKNEINKNEINKNEINKNEINKNEINKNEINKNEINKNEINKNEINKKEINKKEINKNNINKNKFNSLGGWVLLRYGLEELGLAHIYKKIEYNDYKKPYFSGENECYFNISHSGNYCICAISNNEIGCDIEKIRTTMPKIYEKLFHKDEVVFLQSLDESKIDKFIEFWARKESVVKCIGTGFSKKTLEILENPVVNVKPTKELNNFFPSILHKEKVIYINTILKNNYYISIACFNEVWNNSIKNIDFYDLNVYNES